MVAIEMHILLTQENLQSQQLCSEFTLTSSHDAINLFCRLSGFEDFILFLKIVLPMNCLIRIRVFTCSSL